MREATGTRHRGGRARARTGRDLFRDEHGFTTTSMVLSLLITLALVFTAGQVYRVNSASAEVQDVADAAALSAQAQVAEFMIVAQFCDAVVLTLSLSGVVLCGLGVAALCAPPAAELGQALIETGQDLLKTRNEFSNRAKAALSKLQEALPFFAAACAAGVCAANNGDSTGANYVGVGLLVPAKGKDIQVQSNEKADELSQEIDDKADDIRQKSEEAEQAAQEANAAKQRAFEHDCGANPGYCMYERAASLIGLSGAANPLYASVDAWSFSVALDRARTYYGERRFNDEPEGSWTEAIVRWKMRQRFYDYAYNLIAGSGYVYETADSFDANFPHLPRNTEEMRATSLYTEAVYPISEEVDEAAEAALREAEAAAAAEAGEGVEIVPAPTPTMQVMHAWSGCPGIRGPVVGQGSIAYMEGAGLPLCPICQFRAATMGQVASASTSIENGFEYHYDAVAREAEEYEAARERAEEPRRQVKEGVSGLFDQIVEALKESANRRISVEPPGRYGAIALVVNMGSTPASGGFASGFAASGNTVGPRAAVGGATLVKEGSDEGRTVLSSMLDNLREDGGVFVGAAGVALDVWSRALLAYSNGVDSAVGGVESGLNSIPLVGASGLGTWAAEKLRGAVESTGLQPMELDALKPVLVNSTHVAAKDEGSMGRGLVSVKQHVIAHPLYSTDLFTAILTDAEREAIAQVEGLGDAIDIASIEVLGEGGPSIPITIPLPPEVKAYGVSTLQGLFDNLRAQHAETVEVRPWE